MKTLLIAATTLVATPAMAQDDWQPATLQYFGSYSQITNITDLRFEDFEDDNLGGQVYLTGQSFEIAGGALSHNAGQDRSLTITFAQDITGFAGRSLLDGDLSGLTVYASFADGGAEMLRPAIAGYGNGFYGFVSDKAITALNFYSTADAGQRWHLEDMRFGNFATGDAPVVPESASWAMLIAGFGLVGGTLRRKPARARVALA